jgi:hypothetical protein
VTPATAIAAQVTDDALPHRLLGLDALQTRPL